ncbi:MAG TPA: amidohydrolase family protein [Rheinheimera sp.]|uniref:amidohydrolase family protein n=1 Tax=Rheinheimera sp. TaxID=1869214 RepID=UPI002B4A9FD7|nr:amidohydrolase family protein [Rheinheimera sp.]HJS16439.1 amidohydrolase family protein [Rheinheimera sp.]
MRHSFISIKSRFVSISVLSLLMATAPVLAESLLIRNVSIVSDGSSGDNPQVSAAKDVLITNGKIQAIGTRLGQADQQIDATGKYLIPGLIDSHVHLDGVPGYKGHDAKDESMLQQARTQMPRSYAYFGFTTVLDLTGDANFIANWNSAAAGPKAYFCAPVVIPNGYPAVFFGKEGQFKLTGSQYMLYDPAQPDVYPASFNKEEHSPEAVVALAKQQGARCIKVFYETGFGAQRNLPVPSVKLMTDVVAEAKQHGLPVFLHGNSQAAYEFALDTKVNTLVHGLWHPHKGAEPEHNHSKLNRIADLLVKANIAVQPTIQVLYGEQELLNPAFFQNPQVQHAIPKQLSQWYQTEAGQWMNRELAGNFAPAQNPAELYQQIKQAYQQPLTLVRQMTADLNQRGAMLQFGSDTPSGPFYSQFPGINGRWEMDRWLETGLSLSQLFSAMTSGNAKALGMESEIGFVKAGLDADLLLLGSNPLQTVTAYDQIELVILKGKPLQRAELSATQQQ